MTRINKLISLIIMLCIANVLSGQKKWSLEECVIRALDNSLEIQQSALGIKRGEISHNLAKQQFLPNLSASSNYNQSFGRRIDPTTNDFVNQSFGNMGLGLNFGMPIFQGGQLRYNLQDAKKGLEIQKLTYEQRKYDIGLQVVNAFVNVVLAKENLVIRETSLKSLLEEYNRIKQLVQAGAMAEVKVIELDAQIASNEADVLVAKNNISAAKLALKQLLQLPATEDMDVLVPELDINQFIQVEQITSPSIFEEAVANQPQFQIQDALVERAKIGIKQAKASRYPTLSFGGSLGSNYSTTAKTIGNQSSTVFVPQNVKINGQSSVLEVPRTTYNFKDIPFGDQLDQNFGYGIGLSLGIPIYSRGNISASVKQSKIALEESKLNKSLAKRNLQTDIERTVAAYHQAIQQYEAAKRSKEANEMLFNNVRTRYQLSNATGFELNTAQNNYSNAQVNELIAKYNVILQSKLIDYYRGRPLKW